MWADPQGESLLSLVFFPLGAQSLTPECWGGGRGMGGGTSPDTSGSRRLLPVHLEMPEISGSGLSGFPGLLETRWALRPWRRVVISARRSAGAGAREVSGGVFALGASWVEIYQKAA